MYGSGAMTGLTTTAIISASRSTRQARQNREFTEHIMCCVAVRGCTTTAAGMWTASCVPRPGTAAIRDTGTYPTVTATASVVPDEQGEVRAGFRRADAAGGVSGAADPGTVILRRDGRSFTDSYLLLYQLPARCDLYQINARRGFFHR